MKDNEQIAYLAGLFDGEGSVLLTRLHSNTYRAPVLSMSSTTLCLLEKCKETFGGHISTHKIYKSHHKQSWSWTVKSAKALAAMEKLLPYIMEPDKHRRMKLLLDKYNSTTVMNGKYTKEQIQAKIQFTNEFFHPSSAVEKYDP